METKTFKYKGAFLYGCRVDKRTDVPCHRIPGRVRATAEPGDWIMSGPAGTFVMPNDLVETLCVPC